MKKKNILRLILSIGLLVVIMTLLLPALGRMPSEFLFKNVTIRKIDYLTYSRDSGERYKITSKNNPDIVLGLLKALKWHSRAIVYSSGDDVFTFHLRNGVKILVRIEDCSSRRMRRYNKNVYTLRDGIVENEVGLYDGCYLLPQPAKISLIFDGKKIEVDRDSNLSDWSVVYQFAREAALRTEASSLLPQKGFEELKLKKKQPSYLVNLYFDDNAKFSTSRSCDISEASNFMKDSYGNITLESRQILIEIPRKERKIGNFRSIYYQITDGGDSYFQFQIPVNFLRSPEGRDIIHFDELLAIFDKYQPPTAEIKGLERNQ